MRPFKVMRRGVTVTVSIAPASQSAGPATPSGWTFGTSTITVTGGTPSAYVWSAVGGFGGTWGVNSGQGTAVGRAAVSNVAEGETASCNFQCTVTVNGVNYVRSAFHSYEREGVPE